MLCLPNVTVVSVAGINPDVAVSAIRFSQEKVKFATARIISPQRPSGSLKDMEWVAIPPLRMRSPGIDDYSRFVLYDLWRFVETDFCLVVQGDGYVINPQSWTDDFYQFDYIGAPWPKSRTSYIDPWGNQRRVGNGGFSFRSRRLLMVPNQINVPWNVNASSFYKQFEERGLAEDGNISVHNRHIFEENGCTYASVHMAARFSREMPVREGLGVKPFGFHKYLPGKSKLKLIRHAPAWIPGYIGLI